MPLWRKPSDIGLKSIGESAGIDIITQPAEARNWVMEVLEQHMAADHRVTVGNYCYLDGEKHVKLSIAMDVISAAVSGRCVLRSTSLEFLRSI